MDRYSVEQLNGLIADDTETEIINTIPRNAIYAVAGNLAAATCSTLIIHEPPRHVGNGILKCEITLARGDDYREVTSFALVSYQRLAGKSAFTYVEATVKDWVPGL